MVRNGFKKIIYKNMKYVKMFENFEVNKEWQDASKEERDTISIPSYKGTQAYKDIMGEDDIDFIITKIKDNFPKDDIKLKIKDDSDEMDKETALIDMICWFEKTYKDILDEDVVLNKLNLNESAEEIMKITLLELCKQYDKK